jgi:predicted nucleotidyltransferase
VRREQVVEVLRAALEPLAFVNAAWLGGSDAFGRADELSDVDLQVDVDDGQVAAFGAVEAALADMQICP